MAERSDTEAATQVGAGVYAEEPQAVNDSVEDWMDRWEAKQDSRTLVQIWAASASACATCGHPASIHGIYNCYFELDSSNGYKPRCACQEYQERGEMIGESWSTTVAADRIEELEELLKDAYDDVDDLASLNYRLITERGYDPWVLRAEGALVALIASLLAVVILL